MDTEKILNEAEELQQETLQQEIIPQLQVITFVWNRETYAVPLDLVKEIVKVSTITPVPGLAETILGAMNLRGEVLPVINPRPLLELQFGEISAESRLLVVHLDNLPVGILIDAIGDIHEIPAPDSKSQTSDFILSQTTLSSGDLLNLIDLTALLAPFSGN